MAACKPLRRPDRENTKPGITVLDTSCFRSVEEVGQVRLSSRGIVSNPGMSNPEEFPNLVPSWFERARQADAR
ncbi:glucan biosynthesis protein [Methylocaldum marinum]|uniref:glucan biosynthesis protein n=1 Tax=Methylocaldum marinum TaxID=1432792 RepID=UPI000E6A2F3F